MKKEKCVFGYFQCLGVFLKHWFEHRFDHEYFGLVANEMGNTAWLEAWHLMQFGLGP
jgi:hypothetical protein